MHDWNSILQEQIAICTKLKLEWTPVRTDSLIAVNDSLFTATQPINGLRHPRHGTIEGWYLWRSEMQEENDFFKPLHVWHLLEQRPIVLKYLGLPPGWRFQIDDKGYEDIWFDVSILDIL